MDKKPRSDSKLDSMPGQRVMELRDKLMSGSSYKECLAWLSLECGEESSEAALSRFYKRHCWPLVREQRQISVIRAEALGDAMRQDPVNWDEKIIEKTKQLAFEFLSTNPNDPEAVAKLLDAIVKAKKQEFTQHIQTAKHILDERRVRLLEDNAAQAKAKLEAAMTTAKSQGGLTPETLKQIEEAAGLL